MADLPLRSRIDADPAALEHLRADPVMAALIARFGPYGWALLPLFPALLRAVAGQSVSDASAAAVYGRVARATGLIPEGVRSCSVDELRAAGLTRAKGRALHALADAALAGTLDDLAALSDREIEARLGAIRGVGPWTARMLLIFGLGRMDVWPLGDLGVVRRAHARWGVEGRAELAALGERFRPWRSAAVWYLWRDQETSRVR